MMRLWCLLALFSLTGCSVQMAYNNLDRLARWSVSDYVRMDDMQRAYFDHQFRVLWDWHRQDHLPRYAEFLEGLALQFEDGADAEAMRELVEQVIAWVDEVEARALPVAAEVLASLTDPQVADLARALQESNQEMVEPELGATVEESRAAWREEFTGRFTGFSGRLNPVQKAHLLTQSHNYQPELVLWVDYRRRWQRDFLAMLAHRADVDGLEQGLRELSANREAYFGTELRRIYHHNNQLTRDLSVWLINSLTDRQRERFRARLTDLADDFRQLAADTRPRAPDSPAPCLTGC